jgi:TldD protein
MIEHSLIEKILKKTLSRGGDYADIFIEFRKVNSVHLEDGRVEKIISGIDAGAGIRLISKGCTAYAYSNDLSEKALIGLAETLCKGFDEDVGEITIDLRVTRPTIDFPIIMPPDSVPMIEKVRLVRDADRISRAIDDRIRQVSVSYRDSSQRVIIGTSDGRIAEDERIYTTAVIHVIASDEGIIQTGYESAGGLVGFELFKDNLIEEISLSAAKRAVMMLRARRAPGGRMPVVISSEAGGTMIHEAVGHGLEADLVGEGLSVYSGKLGSDIASPLITVIDDPTLMNKRGSYRFDDEGTPSQKTILIEKGILKNYMYDRLTAHKAGVKSTGNGRRESYQSRPIPRMSNTYIASGESSPESIIRATPRGLFVKKMGGGQVNTVTGEFVFEVQEGYLIENGNIGEPVREATLIGNGPEVLKSIDMVGSDLGFSIGTCGKDSQGVPVSDGMPTVRIPDLVVGGEV